MLLSTAGVSESDIKPAVISYNIGMACIISSPIPDHAYIVPMVGNPIDNASGAILVTIFATVPAADLSRPSESIQSYLFAPTPSTVRVSHDDNIVLFAGLLPSRVS